MISPKIVIIDYGVGNTHSVYNAIECLKYTRIRISDNEKIIRDADALVLPGVGAFDACAKNLRERNLDHMLNEQVLVKEKPILGICVGMQLMASFSEENGVHSGLNWIEGRVKKLTLEKPFFVPHVGWNDIKVNKSEPLFLRNDAQSNFYFDHSYFFDCKNEYVAAYCDYGIKITAAVQLKNIFGVQFHPEKSHTNGLKLFRSFFNSI